MFRLPAGSMHNSLCRVNSLSPGVLTSVVGVEVVVMVGMVVGGGGGEVGGGVGKLRLVNSLSPGMLTSVVGWLVVEVVVVLVEVLLVELSFSFFCGVN